jgi:hypothetical protein
MNTHGMRPIRQVGNIELPDGVVIQYSGLVAVEGSCRCHKQACYRRAASADGLCDECRTGCEHRTQALPAAGIGRGTRRSV